MSELDIPLIFLFHSLEKNCEKYHNISSSPRHPPQDQSVANSPMYKELYISYRHIQIGRLDLFQFFLVFNLYTLFDDFRPLTSGKSKISHTLWSHLMKNTTYLPLKLWPRK